MNKDIFFPESPISYKAGALGVLLFDKTKFKSNVEENAVYITRCTVLQLLGLAFPRALYECDSGLQKTR